jgi:hypothetical protein
MTMMTHEEQMSARSDNDQPDEVINTGPARTVLGGLLPGLVALAWPSWSYYLSRAPAGPAGHRDGHPGLGADVYRSDAPDHCAQRVSPGCAARRHKSCA